MTQLGFLIISDITGYSAYLNESELEHARDSLTDLIKILIDHTRSPLILSKLEGDAVFSYAPAGNFLTGQTFLEMIEVTYVAFRKALDLMVLNTSCTCNACRNLPNLDLKFFAHYGEYSIQDFGDIQELVGPDVNLVHRLVKNAVVETTRLKAYAAYTQALIDALKMDDLADHLLSYSESFADVGEVRLYIQDLHGIWEDRKESLRVVVEPDEAIYSYEFVLPAPVPMVWDFITQPPYRNYYLGTDSQKISGKNEGRIGPGTVYVCAHGDQELVQTLLDYVPLETYTYRNADRNLPVFNVTVKLTAVEQGTKIQAFSGQPNRGWIIKALFKIIMPIISRRFMPKLVSSLREEIAKTMAEIEFGPTPSFELGSDSVAAAAKESLKENVKT